MGHHSLMGHKFKHWSEEKQKSSSSWLKTTQERLIKKKKSAFNDCSACLSKHNIQMQNPSALGKLANVFLDIKLGCAISIHYCRVHLQNQSFEGKRKDACSRKSIVGCYYKLYWWIWIDMMCVFFCKRVWVWSFRVHHFLFSIVERKAVQHCPHSPVPSERLSPPSVLF